MTDFALSTLARAAAADPSLRPNLLHARLRAGLVSRERVEVAAYCGHEVARAVVSEPHVNAWLHAWIGDVDKVAREGERWCGAVFPGERRKTSGMAACRLPVGHDGSHYLVTGERGGSYAHIPATFDRWLSGLSRWPAAEARAALAAGEAWAEAWEADYGWWWRDRLFRGRLIGMRDIWQSRRALRACRRALDDPSPANREALRELREWELGRNWDAQELPAWAWEIVYMALADCCISCGNHAQKALRLLAESVPEARLREAICRELIAWSEVDG